MVSAIGPDSRLVTILCYLNPCGIIANCQQGLCCHSWGARSHFIVCAYQGCKLIKYHVIYSQSSISFCFMHCLCCFVKYHFFSCCCADVGKMMVQSQKLIQKGTRGLYLPSRLIFNKVYFVSLYFTHELIKLMSVSITTAIIEGGRKRCLWVLLKGWKGESILSLYYFLNI